MEEGILMEEGTGTGVVIPIILLLLLRTVSLENLCLLFLCRDLCALSTVSRRFSAERVSSKRGKPADRAFGEHCFFPLPLLLTVVP